MVRFIPFLTLTLALTATLALIIGCGPAATTDTGAGAGAAAATTATAPDATASQPAPANALTVTATDAPPAGAAGQAVTTTATASTESTESTAVTALNAVTAPVQTPAEAPGNISPVGAEPEPESVEPSPAPLQLNPPDSADAPTPPAAAAVDPDTAITVTPIAPDRVAPANPVAAAEPSGSAAPRFSLPSANYETVALDSYIGEKNVVLVFYRAFWWTYCRRQLVELQKDYAEIDALNAEVLAVSADDLKGANYVIEELGLKFPILYDVSTEVVAEYEVFDLLGDGLPTPAVFVLDRAGNIRWQYVGKAYTDIPANAAIIEQLQALEKG
jgi:peroxiredoxin